jgi:heme/copper-type cytochrome/quinol oxidase subunit 2
MPSHILKWGTLFVGLFAGGAGAALAQDPSAPLGLPPGHSTIAPAVDHLYNVILWITGVTFVGVEGLLLWFCIRYRRRPGGRPGYTHGNNTAEIIWTVSPALVLIFIAIYQFAAWKNAKIDFPDPTKPDVVTIQAFAQQYQWNFRHAGTDGNVGTDDDVILNRRFWLPAGATAYIPLRSVDVIHSFFLFQMRVKQDAVPGLVNRVWFKPTGFYVAKIDKNAAPFNSAYKVNWRPKDTKKKWEGEYKFEFVNTMNGESEFQSKYGSFNVAIDSSLQYQDGLFRPALPDVKSTVIRNNEIVKNVPWREVDYVIVPYEGTCAELCGQGHFTMTIEMWVLPRRAYDFYMADDNFYAENAEEKVLDLWKQWQEGPIRK